MATLQQKLVCRNYCPEVSVHEKIISSGQSAGAHLSAILCYSKKIQKAFGIDISPVTEFIGVSASYSFSEKQTLAVRLLLNQLFPKNYDRTQGEPCSPMEASAIPMLLIQSRHDVHT